MSPETKRLRSKTKSEKSEANGWLIPRQSITLFLAFGILVFGSVFLTSCNQPFQPIVNYKPQLAMYSILFANKQGVYVRLFSTTGSIDGSVNNRVHGAEVGLLMKTVTYDTAGYDTVWTEELDSVSYRDTSYYYYSPMMISSAGFYGIVAEKSGYPPVCAFATVPYSFVTIPDSKSYAALRFPDSVDYNPYFWINLGGSVAYFPQIFIEYRGFDSTGAFHSGFINASGSTPTDPFIQSMQYGVQYTVDRFVYSSQFDEVRRVAGNLTEVHFYVDVVVTQLDDPLYRFYITSGRWYNPLAMRTDRPIYSNVINGEGIVGGAAVDTTRIFLY